MLGWAVCGNCGAVLPAERFSAVGVNYRAWAGGSGHSQALQHLHVPELQRV